MFGWNSEDSYFGYHQEPRNKTAKATKQVWQQYIRGLDLTICKIDSGDEELIQRTNFLAADFAIDSV